MPKKQDKPTAPVLFRIEVPADRRETFWKRPPKDKAEFWAFRDRPRAFINEKIIFTFDRKPVAEARIWKIEGPGKSQCGETGEYKDHHKVFWKQPDFRRYSDKTAGGKWIGPVFHGTMSTFKKLKGQPDAAGMTYFTDDAEYANNFALDSGRYKENSAIYPAYIRFNKPFDARNWSEEKLTPEEYARAVGTTKDAMWDETFQMPVETYFWRFLLMFPKTSQAALAKQGYDGIMLTEAIDKSIMPDTASFVVFKDSQIRPLYGKKPKQVLDLRTGAVPTFRSEQRGYHHGQSDMTLFAEVGGQSVGFVEYAVYDDAPNVQMLKVSEGNRRKGYGTALLKELQRMFPKTEINLGYASNEGGELLKSMQFEEQPTEYAEEFKEVAALKLKAQELQRIADEYHSKDDHTEEERSAFVQQVDKWNDLHDRIWELEQKLQNRKPMKKIITADEVLDVGDGDEYWAGEGNAASGILPVCPSKGTVCLAMRSDHVMTPNCWGTIGGAVQQGKSPAQSAKAELKEETGYSGGMTLMPAYVFSDRGFSYHNFIGVVGSEFSFSPQPYGDEEAAEVEEMITNDPRQRHRRNPGWETTHITWQPYAQVVADMAAHAGDYHPGMLKLFVNSRKKIEEALGLVKQEVTEYTAEQVVQMAKAKNLPAEIVMRKNIKHVEPISTVETLGLYREWSKYLPKNAKQGAQKNPALDAFMRDMWAQTSGNPFNNRERVYQNKAIIEASPFGGRIHLSFIRSVEPKKGWGSEGLDFLIKLAEKHSVEIELGADQVGDEGLTTGQLISWYKRHGFKQEKGMDSSSLIYSPKTEKPLKLGPNMRTIPIKSAATSRLYQLLLQCRPNIAQHAQELYDAWEQDADGVDEELGSGGICDQISDSIQDLVGSVIHEVGGSVREGGQEGDDHAWVIAFDDKEAYGVDIHHGVYEFGGGYNWKKKPGVQFDANDVEIFKVDIDPAQLKEARWVKKAAGFAFKSFPKLWHVGDMNPTSKRPGSYEGAGLSVSVHPEDWMEIAEIGGDLWELTKSKNKFVNFHRLSKPQRAQIGEWGVQNGYVTPVQIWRATWYDEEREENVYSDFLTQQEAQQNLEGKGTVKAVKNQLQGTEKLKQRTNNTHAGDSQMAFDLLVTVYAEDQLDCDGVWWADTYDPSNLSAPRGVIFPSKLQSWSKRVVESTEDEEEQPDAAEIKKLRQEIKAYGDQDGVLRTRLQMLLKKKTSSDDNYYMEEGCGIFAVALAQLHPKGDLKVIRDMQGEPWNESIPYNLSHVYCSTPSANYDVKGARSVEQMAGDLNIADYSVIGGWGWKEFMKKFMGMGDVPLYGERSDVEEAKQIILANPEKYGLPKTAAVVRPTATQLDGLQHMAGGKALYRVKGGFWTVDPVASYDKHGLPKDAEGKSIWYVPAGTVAAMEKRGWIARANKYPEQWKDDRMITDAGLLFVMSKQAAALEPDSIDTDPDKEFNRMFEYAKSLGWRGMNPWYPDTRPWFALRLYSDGWKLSNELAKVLLAEGSTLAELQAQMSKYDLDELRGEPSTKTIDAIPVQKKLHA